MHIDDRFKFVKAMAQGMLAHSERYKQRDVDSDKHWHEAMMN